jgi:hypothetical protein
VSDVIAELEALIKGMSEEDKAELDKLILPELKAIWLPNPGPQTSALHSEADILLYGGAAGGGKSDLLIGAALTQHDRTVLFRRQFTDLKGLEQRLFEIAGRSGWNGQDHAMRRPDGRVIEFGALEKPESEKSWQGRPHDLIGFDEGAQLPEAKVRFVMGWLRSAKEGQRCRVIIASNPPIGAEGDWMVVWFAPWLDAAFDNPAAPGELRWAVIAPDGSTVWVSGPGYYVVSANENGALQCREATPEEVADAELGKGDALKAMSRTFIPARLDDNPYLRTTNYRASVMALPEPLRSKLLKGDFMAGKEDAANQVIPTAWIEAAMERWKQRSKPTCPMTTLGVDVAQGGSDKTVLAPLYDTWFGELVRKDGVDTKNGAAVGALVIEHMRDKCQVNIDLTGGWGGGAQTHLEDNVPGIRVEPVVFSEGSPGERTRESQLEFLNKRAELWWRFREALDPVHGDDIALPPDRRLAAQLASPTWWLKSRSGAAAIQIEQKDEIRKRLGSSTDDADAVIIAWYRRRQALSRIGGSERRSRRRGARGGSGWMGA